MYAYSFVGLTLDYPNAMQLCKFNAGKSEWETYIPDPLSQLVE